MALPVYIEDKGTRLPAKVTEYNQIVVGPLDYSTAYNTALVVDNQPYELVRGKVGSRFVITDLLIVTLKSVSPSTAATIVIYEAEVADISTNVGTIVELDMLARDKLAVTGLNIISQGKARSLVGTTTDGTVNVLVSGYYVPTD